MRVHARVQGFLFKLFRNKWNKYGYLVHYLILSLDVAHLLTLGA